MRLCCCCVCIAVAVATTTDVVDVDVDALFVDDEDDVNQLSSFSIFGADDETLLLIISYIRFQNST
jgi:hypothetical protein